MADENASFGVTRHALRLDAPFQEQVLVWSMRLAFGNDVVGRNEAATAEVSSNASEIRHPGLLAALRNLRISGSVGSDAVLLVNRSAAAFQILVRPCKLRLSIKRGARRG